MEKYLGVKMVNAEKCWGLNNKCVDPNSEHCGQEVDGYKVVYEDGYTSWSPKDVFEKAYKKTENYSSIILDVNTINGNWDYYNSGDCEECQDCKCDCESIN